MKKTFYPVLCSKDDGEPSGYEFHGYRITNSGSGWVVRGGDKYMTVVNQYGNGGWDIHPPLLFKVTADPKVSGKLLSR